MIEAQYQIHRKSLRRVFYAFLILSMFIHLATLSTHFDYVNKNKFLPLANKDQAEPIKLRLIEEDKKQIVETEQSENIKNLNKIRDRFLSNKNNTFEKETVAKNIGKFRNSKSQSSENLNKSPAVAKKLSLENIGLTDFSKFKIKETEKTEKNKLLNEQSKQPSKSSVVSQTNDYIDDVPTGELTQLNTSEFKFYGFYYRIKQRLEQHWGNSLREKARTLTRRSMASSVDRVTALVVILDSLGRIVNVHLKSTSGVEELDAAAIESFNKAGPFPNPPKEMLENGKAKIEWGFVVKT